MSLAVFAVQSDATADSPSIDRARNVARQMRKNDVNIDEIIRTAEKETGGTAVEVQLIDPSEWKGHARRMNKEGRSVKEGHDRCNAEYRVTCLVNGAKLRNVYVCPKEATVHAVLSSSRADRFARRNDSYTRNRQNRRTRVDRSYIEQGNWPPDRGNMLYDEYRSGRNDNWVSRRDRTYYREHGYNRNRGYGQDDDYEYSGGYREPYVSQRYSIYAPYDLYDDRDVYPGPMDMATRLINATAIDSRGRDIGDIEDVAINPDDGRIVYVALARGGFLGLGEDLFAVPSSEILWVDNDIVKLDIDRSEVRGEDGFSDDDWPMSASRRFTYVERGEAQRIVKASDILGRDLKNNASEELGEVQNLVLDIDAGRVAHLIIDNDHDGKQTAVPFAAIRCADDECVVALQEDRFERLPSFDEGNYPNFTSRGWNRRTFNDFGVKPYWDQITKTSSASVSRSDEL